jgi:hypothetical protein
MHDEDMTKNTIKVEIESDRSDEDSPAKLVFKGLDDTNIDLTDSSINDIKVLFDKIFDYIVDSRCFLEFELDDTKNDLFHDVSKDIIDQLNSELTESKDNLEKIWALIPENDTIQNEEETE